MLHIVCTRSWLAAVVALALAGPAHAALPCDADLDDDGAVGVTDFLLLLAAWGTDPGGPPDFNGDGTVGITDFLDLLAAWGPIAFDYGPAVPDAEAQQIGLEMLGASGALLVPPDVYERIDFDLDLIRNFEPGLLGQTHSPAWLANELIVQLIPAAPEGEYLCLNEQYQVIAEDNLFGDWWVLTFAGNLNIPALAQVYMQAPNVQVAEPNGLIGGQNFWTPTDHGTHWIWEIDDGWLDCFDGCDCHRLYTFRTTTGGSISLIGFVEFGQPWCEFE
ncbi:MAG: hypothetical protein ACYS15_12855 [Planctomycetota bacterium]|jgi:hypothetical protein